MRIETERLVLRDTREADVVPLADLWIDPEVTRFMGGPRDYEWLLAAFEQEAREGMESELDLRPVLEKVSGELVGHCGLIEKEVDDQCEVELVYAFRPAVWGKGYATEVASALRDYAFQELGLRRLISLIDPDNRLSARVAQKVGMVFERETIRLGGNRLHIYAIEMGGSAPRSTAET